MVKCIVPKKKENILPKKKKIDLPLYLNNSNPLFLLPDWGFSLPVDIGMVKN